MADSKVYALLCLENPLLGKSELNGGPFHSSADNIPKISRAKGTRSPSLENKV